MPSPLGVAPTLAQLAAYVDRPTTVVTSAVTLAAAGTYLIGAGGAPTLPTAVGDTKPRTVKNTTAVAITLATTSGQTIDGAAGPISIGPYASLTLISDNTNWWVV